MSFKRVDTTAHRLKIAMNNAGKKQSDLARETGIDKGSMSHYVNGRYEPKQDVIFALATALNVSEMWLWGYDCPMERPAPNVKNNDTLTDIVVRMRTDEEFASILKGLNQLDSVQLASVKQVVFAFLSKKG